MSAGKLPDAVPRFPAATDLRKTTNKDCMGANSRGTTVRPPSEWKAAASRMLPLTGSQISGCLPTTRKAHSRGHRSPAPVGDEVDIGVLGCAMDIIDGGGGGPGRSLGVNFRRTRERLRIASECRGDK